MNYAASNTNSIIAELSNLNPPTTEFNNKLMLNALTILHNPQNGYKVIHIAGTNGKGSTAAYLEEALYQSGFKVGKYTSPNIHLINECILLNKELISDEALSCLYLELKSSLNCHDIYPSSFEMLTLIMFVFFARQKIDYLILETGMGGLNDATNVVNSQFSIITNISLEHQAYLGNTLEQIARHKAGIIKDGITIIGANSKELINAVKHKTADYINIHTKYHHQVKLDYQNFTSELSFQDGNNQYKQLTLGLFGHFQAFNFLCAYAVLEHIGIEFDIIKRAAKNVRWVGRLQRINNYPLIIADAAHNEDGAQMLTHNLRPYQRLNDSIIICSILADKNISRMLDSYRQISPNIIFCSILNQPRASSAYKLAQAARHKFNRVYIIQSPQVALNMARKMQKKIIIISGSIYLLKNFLQPPQL